MNMRMTTDLSVLWLGLVALASSPRASYGRVVHLPMLPHSHVMERRLRESSRRVLEGNSTSTTTYNEDTRQIAGLYQGYGTHYVDLWVGSPVPQRQTVIVDTGSQTTAFPCAGCRDCGEQYHTDGYFMSGDSTTFRTLGCDECRLGHCRSSENSCTMGLAYQEGSSWNAFESVDIVFAGGPHTRDEDENDTVPNNPNGLSRGELPVGAPDYAFPLHFGCQNRITGLFKTQLADGIMGMSNDGASFWQQMYENEKIDSKEFSLCFRREEYAEADGTPAGAMTLGGVESRLHLTPMVYAANTRSSGFYSVVVNAIYFRTDGALVSWGDDDEVVPIPVDISNLNRLKTIVDSGTTDTYINRAAMGPFMEEWKKITGFDYHNDKLKLTDEQLEKIPSVIIQLKGDEESNQKAAQELGVKPEDLPGLAASIDPTRPYDIMVAIPPVHFVEYFPDDDTYSSRLYVDERGGTVLGANAMRGHDVHFDVEGGRIGWAESGCDYRALTGQAVENEENDEINIDGNGDSNVGVYGDTTTSGASEEQEDEYENPDVEIMPTKSGALRSPFTYLIAALPIIAMAGYYLDSYRRRRRETGIQAMVRVETEELAQDDVGDDDDNAEEFDPVVQEII